MFTIHFSRLIALLLPSFYRKPLLLALLKSACTPLVSIYTAHKDYRAANRFYIQHTPQVCSIVDALNSTFKSDFSGRTFSIVENETQIANWEYAIGEDYTVMHSDMLYATAEDLDGEDQTGTVPVLYHAQDLNTAHNDFIVRVPSDIYYNRLNAVKALVNRYKLPTKVATYEPC